jgi:hypothetical protein
MIKNAIRLRIRSVTEVNKGDGSDEAVSTCPFVNRSDACLAGQHERPFRFLMPVQFAYTTGRKPHVDSGDGGRSRKLACNLPLASYLRLTIYHGFTRGNRACIRARFFYNPASIKPRWIQQARPWQRPLGP